jgi:hypothetical protein
MADRNTFAGLDGLYVSFLNSAGLMSGFSNISATPSASGLRKIKAAQKLPSALQTPNKKYIKGDDSIHDTFQFAADTLPTGTVEVGETDLTLDAAAQSSTNWTLGNWQQAIYGISNPSFANMMLLSHQQSHSQDLANPGQAGFMNILYPNTQLLPMGEDDPAYQQEGKNQYSVSFLPFLVHPTGSSLTTNFGVTDGLKIKWWSRYRTMFYAAIMAGSVATITLDNTPVDTASIKAFQTSAGVTTQLTVSSVNTSTRVVTLSTSPTAGDLVVVIYEASRILI